jgi:hypothetical protein
MSLPSEISNVRSEILKESQSLPISGPSVTSVCSCGKFCVLQGVRQPGQGLARLREPWQGPRKNSSASLSCKPSASFPISIPICAISGQQFQFLFCASCASSRLKFCLQIQTLTVSQSPAPPFPLRPPVQMLCPSLAFMKPCHLNEAFMPSIKPKNSRPHTALYRLIQVCKGVPAFSPAYRLDIAFPSEHRSHLCLSVTSAVKKFIGFAFLEFRDPDAVCRDLLLKIFRSPSALNCVLCGETSSGSPFVISGLLKIKSHKPIQGGHKPKQGHTSQYKAKQGPQKNRITSLVHKPSPSPRTLSETSSESLKVLRSSPASSSPRHWGCGQTRQQSP